MVHAQNQAIEAENLLNESVEQANVTEAELKKKSKYMVKLESVVAKVNVQN